MSFAAIIIVNVRNYYAALREQIRVSVEAGFVRAENVQLITFLDGPTNIDEHDEFDWGAAVVKTLDEWKPTGWKGFGFDWSKTRKGIVAPLETT